MLHRPYRLVSLLSALLWVGVPAASVSAQDRPDDDFDEEFEEDWEEDYEELDEGDEELEQDDEYFDDEGADEPEEPATPEEREEAQWQQSRRVHNTWDGTTGGLRVADAGSGPTDSFRVQLLTEFFSTSDFLVVGDDHEHVGGVLSLGYAPLDFLEAYASLSYYSNSNPLENPSLFQTFGDGLLGAKVWWQVGPPWLSLGGDVSVELTTGTGAGLDLSAMGARFRAIGSADFRELEKPIPLQTRLNLAYRVDNTGELVAGTERRRYDSLDMPFPEAEESRHLVTPIERFGLNMNRTDFFEIGLGVEAPVHAGDEFYIHPFAEWTLGLPINRQGYSCLFVPAFPGAAEPVEGDDSCIADEGASALPQVLTLGLRFLPPVEGFSTLVAIDIGLSGTSPDDSVRELSATPPWNFVLGASYSFDVRGPPDPEIIEREVPVEVEVQEDPPPSGRVRGRVFETEDGTPVPGATIDFLGRSDTSQITDDGGGFVTMAFPPGDAIEMAVSAEEHDPGQCSATIPEDGGDIEVRCELTRQRLVVVEESEVIIFEQINFAFDSDEILESSFGLMEAITRTLIDNAQLTKIEIQGHTDDEGTPEYNLELSQRRADSVKRWLSEHGVEEGRLDARGYGLTVPLVPNDSDENRARNRRVQFIIVEQADPPAPDVEGDAPTTEPAPEPEPDDSQ